MDFLKNIEGIKVWYDEPMCHHTSFRVGGRVKALVVPESVDALKAVAAACKKEGVKLYFIGNGSNLLVADEGLDGVVIKLFGGLTEIKVSGTEIEVDAGVLLSTLAKQAQRNALTGLEFAEGIPGTVGGALVMNAGAYDGEIKQVIKKIICLDGDEIKELSKEEIGLGYRTSKIQANGMIVLRAIFSLEKGDEEEILAKMKDFRQRRKDKQPLEFPSAGSTFKRPEGHFAGKLIQDAGLRGYKHGGAMVSDKHCGFVINYKDATCKDILELIEHIQNTVFEKFGVKLETEVKYLK